jgi:hypothetical protein
MCKITYQTEKWRVSTMDIHLWALKTASLIDGILYTTRFSERIGDLNICYNRLFTVQSPRILIDSAVMWILLV